MGSLRTFVCGLGLTLAMPALPAASGTEPDATRLFATCTGRLSALMEFQWLVQDPGADQTEVQRDRMAELLEAATPVGDAAQAMGLRIEAKAAEAALLQLALTPKGGWALAQARRHVADCTALLLS